MQVLLVHPVTTLLMMGTVAAVIVFLVGGELWILNLRFNECANRIARISHRSIYGMIAA